MLRHGETICEKKDEPTERVTDGYNEVKQDALPTLPKNGQSKDEARNHSSELTSAPDGQSVPRLCLSQFKPYALSMPEPWLLSNTKAKRSGT